MTESSSLSPSSISPCTPVEVSHSPKLRGKSGAHRAPPEPLQDVPSSPRCVSFALEQVEVIEFDLDQEEDVGSKWYSLEEYQEIEVELSKVLKRMQSGKKPSKHYDEGIGYYGLDYIARKAQRDEWISRTSMILFAEQRRQRQSGVSDPDRLAKIYKGCIEAFQMPEPQPAKEAPKKPRRGLLRAASLSNVYKSDNNNNNNSPKASSNNDTRSHIGKGIPRSSSTESAPAPAPARRPRPGLSRAMSLSRINNNIENDSDELPKCPGLFDDGNFKEKSTMHSGSFFSPTSRRSKVSKLGSLAEFSTNADNEPDLSSPKPPRPSLLRNPLPTSTSPTPPPPSLSSSPDDYSTPKTSRRSLLSRAGSFKLMTSRSPKAGLTSPKPDIPTPGDEPEDGKEKRQRSLSPKFPGKGLLRSASFRRKKNLKDTLSPTPSKPPRPGVPRTSSLTSDMERSSTTDTLGTLSSHEEGDSELFGSPKSPKNQQLRRTSSMGDFSQSDLEPKLLTPKVSSSSDEPSSNVTDESSRRQPSRASLIRSITPPRFRA